MADPRAFISFDFDNNYGERLYFVGQSKNSRTPFNIEDWSSKEVLPQHEWEELIENKVKRCNLLIVLVGTQTFKATGVVKEIKFANRNGVPMFGVYVGGAGSNTALPLGLSKGRVVDWNWKSIAAAIEQCMKEGKNK